MASNHDGTGDGTGGEAVGARARWAVAVLAVHLVASYAATYPAVHHVDDSVFGSLRGDKFQFVWIFWWVKHALLELGQLPYFTDLQYHPTGVTLALHDMTYFWSLLSVPLQLLASPVTVLNLFLLVSLPLNGLAFYRLASTVTGEPRGALAGSLVFAYSPFLLGRFGVSHVQYVAVFFVPLFLLSLWRYRRDPRLCHLAWAGAWLGLQSLITFYYGIALGLVLAVFLAHHALRSRRWRTTFLHAAASAALAWVIVLPAAGPILWELGRGSFRETIDASDYGYLENSAADLVAYVVPSFNVARWRGWSLTPALEETAQELSRAMHGHPASKAMYPGWVSFAALLAVLARPTLRRRARPWLALTLGFFVLTLGPTLYVGGQPYLQGWLPGRVISWIPGVNIIRGPARFAPFVTLGTGMLLALAIASLRERRGSRVALRVAVASMIFTALEFAPDATPVFSRKLPLSPFYAGLAEDPDRFTLLNVPVDFRGAKGGGDLYQYAQTVHGRPIVSGYVSREPERVFETLARFPFLLSVEHQSYQPDPRLRLTGTGLANMPTALDALDVRYVIVHRSELPGVEWQRVNAWLVRGPLEAVYQDSLIRVYRVVRPASGG